MNSPLRALIFSYSDSLYYYAGTTTEPEGKTDSVTFVKSSDGKLQKFPSLFRAQQALINLGFDQGWLIMQSAYDELIGQEPAQKAELFMYFKQDELLARNGS